MNRLKIIAFTHKSIELANLSLFFIEETKLKNKLEFIKKEIGLSELFYLSTCNRIEFAFCTSDSIENSFLYKFFKTLNNSWDHKKINWIIKHSIILEGEEAVRHLLNVTASLDSMVVGEREIITQVRKAYDNCHKLGLTGDLIRLTVKSAIKTAKEVYTHTRIADKPISVVSLAYRKLLNLKIPLNARFLIIGAGQTNAAMAKYLLKHGFKNFAVFNRTLKNAENLAAELKGRAYQLSKLDNYNKGFDVIISCTASPIPIITKKLYTKLLLQEDSKKILIDLAIPNDIDRTIARNFNVNLIEISDLKSTALKNLSQRQDQLNFAKKIVEQNILEFRRMLKTRKIELAMQEVPIKIKEIKQKAINNIFAKDIAQLDEQSKDILEKVMTYMEKKYISIPMVIAKNVLVEPE